MTQTKEKRAFYNTGVAKGYTRRNFYEDVQAMLEGEELTDEAKELMAKAVDYELEGMAMKAAASKRVAKDPMDSDYAQAILRDIVPLMSRDEAFTATELADMAAAEGLFSPTGKKYANVWVSRVLANPAMANRVKIISKVVEKVGKDGLKREAEVKAYMLA